MESFLIQNRIVNTSKLNRFALNKKLLKKVVTKLKISKLSADILLKAYKEFIEMKIVYRDWNNCYIQPSWCIHEAWKLHMTDTKEYTAACHNLCGHTIFICPSDGVEEYSNIQDRRKLTTLVYKTRFNRDLVGSVWSFDYVKGWWKDYLHKNLTIKTKVEKRSTELKNNKKEKLKIESSSSLPYESPSPTYDPIKPNSFYVMKANTGNAGRSSRQNSLDSSISTDDRVLREKSKSEEHSTSATEIEVRSSLTESSTKNLSNIRFKLKRNVFNNGKIVTRSMAKKRKLDFQ